MWKIFLPMASSAGLWRSKRSASPPTSTVISPRAARCTPPVTGASNVRMPRASAIFASRIISSRPLVEFSIQVPPGFSPSRIWTSTFSETVGEGRQVNT